MSTEIFKLSQNETPYKSQILKEHTLDSLTV